MTNVECQDEDEAKEASEADNKGIHVISPEEAVKEHHIIASESCLEVLAKMTPPTKCLKCGNTTIQLSHRVFGTSYIFLWVSVTVYCFSALLDIINSEEKEFSSKFPQNGISVSRY